MSATNGAGRRRSWRVRWNGCGWSLRRAQRRGSSPKLKPFLTGGLGLPNQEATAAELGIPMETLRSHLSRLRARYRALLREEVASTIAVADDVEEELRHLFRSPPRPGLTERGLSHARSRPRASPLRAMRSRTGNSTSSLGCINCLRLAALGEPEIETAASSITKSASVRMSRSMS